MALDTDVARLKNRINLTIRLTGALQESIEFYRAKRNELPAVNIDLPRSELEVALDAVDDRLASILKIIVDKLDMDTTGVR